MWHNASHSTSLPCLLIILSLTPQKKKKSLQVQLNFSPLSTLPCSSVPVNCPLLLPPPHIGFMCFCSVIPFSDITASLLSLPRYSTLGKSMHSNREAPCCCSKAVLKRFSIMHFLLYIVWNTSAFGKKSNSTNFSTKNWLFLISSLSTNHCGPHQKDFNFHSKWYKFRKRKLKCSLENLLNVSLQKYQ